VTKHTPQVGIYITVNHGNVEAAANQLARCPRASRKLHLSCRNFSSSTEGSSRTLELHQLLAKARAPGSGGGSAQRDQALAAVLSGTRKLTLVRGAQRAACL